MNAINDALAQVGVKNFEMPATPARVWAAIQAARSGDGGALALERGYFPPAGKLGTAARK